jgi:hypothetical protein
MDEDIIKRIRAQTDPESLRQSLYDLSSLSDKERALSIAVEYTHHDNWMVRRNAIMVLGQLQDSRAAPRLLEIIQNEVGRRKKWVQIGDKSDAIGQDVDIHILKACVDSIIQCSDPEHILALSKYTDRLTYEWMFGDATISKIKEAMDHVPGRQSQTAVPDDDISKLRKSVEEERRSWQAWLREENERLAKEQIELRKREQQLAEKEHDLNALATQQPIHLQSGKIVDSIEVTINDTRYTIVKNKVTPYEYIRKSLVESGLNDSSITYDSDALVFTIKFGEYDGLKHDEIIRFISKHIVNLRYRINYREIPDGYEISREPPKYAGPILIICAIAVIAIVLIMALNGNNIVAPPNVTPIPKITQVPNVIVTQPPTIQYCEVGGRVVTKTGQGIADATVVMGRQSVVTDNNGYYKIGGVPIGNCWVIVWNPAATDMIYEKTIPISGSTNSLNLVEGTSGS